MKKIVIFILTILSINQYITAQTDQLIKKNISIFYPSHYDIIKNQPSFALLNEPKPIGSIPKNWRMKPHFYTKAGKTIATLVIEKGTNLYGTGENTGSLVRNGKNVTLWNTDTPSYKKDSGKRLYQSHPWVLGVNKDGSSFGIIADNTWKQEIDLSDSIRFISDGPAFRVVVIQGNTPQEVVEELSNLVGRMEMPPLWSLGYQQCRWSYFPETRIKNIADTFRLKKLPCDVIWMDIDYMDKYKIFSFDKQGIPNPTKLNNYLHLNGFHSVWMIDPGVSATKGDYVYDSGSEGNNWVQTAEHKEYQGSVWPGPCVFPDFTRPETRTWWRDLFTDFMATGVDGVWNDMNEPSVFNGPDATMPITNWHRGGNGLQPDVHLRYHNVYGMLMAKASREGIMKANPQKRPFVLTRAGYLGSNRYAASWTGDNEGTVEHMKLSIPMSLNLGLSGQPFNGPDLGGFMGNTSADLYGQWIAMGTFFPFMRGHACKGTNNKEPWAFGPEIEEVSRTALNRRYRLLPYYYSLFHEAVETGLPVMRPVFFADAKDTCLRKEEQVFLIGNDILIIPKWAVNPAIPKGIWRTISISGENSTLNKYQADVKVKGGAIIPLGKIIETTAQYNLDSLTLLVSLNTKGRAKGNMYEDAGDGFQYKKGEYLISSFEAIKTGSEVKVLISRKKGNLKRPGRKYKICIVTEKSQVESDWFRKNIIVVKL